MQCSVHLAAAVAVGGRRRRCKQPSQSGCPEHGRDPRRCLRSKQLSMRRRLRRLRKINGQHAEVRQLAVCQRTKLGIVATDVHLVPFRQVAPRATPRPARPRLERRGNRPRAGISLAAARLKTACAARHQAARAAPCVRLARRRTTGARCHSTARTCRRHYVAVSQALRKLKLQPLATSMQQCSTRLCR